MNVELDLAVVGNVKLIYFGDYSNIIEISGNVSCS
jgi:hypothetical protein